MIIIVFGCLTRFPLADLLFKLIPNQIHSSESGPGRGAWGTPIANTLHLNSFCSRSGFDSQRPNGTSKSKVFCSMPCRLPQYVSFDSSVCLFNCSCLDPPLGRTSQSTQMGDFFVCLTQIRLPDLSFKPQVRELESNIRCPLPL